MGARQGARVAPLGATPAMRIALVGETMAEVRRVMIEGVSGVLAVHGAPSARSSSLRSGSSCGRTARWRRCSRPRTPTACAGRSSTAAGATSWRSGAMPEEAWDMLQFALRLGAHPQAVVTTTPRPMPLLKKLLRRRGDAW